MSKTKKLLDEAKAQHRKLKHEMLELIEKCGTARMTKEKIADELFILYKGLK